MNFFKKLFKKNDTEVVEVIKLHRFNGGRIRKHRVYSRY